MPTTRVIHEGTEQLLLEGMRRMDENGGPAEEPVHEMDFSATRIDDIDGD